MQKKKSLIVFVSIIVFLMIFSLVMAIIYLKTDLLKSNKQLFLKYLIEENQMLEVISSNQKEENKQKSYTSTGTIDFIYEYSDDIEKVRNDQISKNLRENIIKAKKLESISGNIKSSVDKENKRELYKLELLKNEKNIMNFEIARDDDKYAFKSKELLKAYIGLENNNLNEFFQNMGLENSDLIPSKIDFNKISQSVLDINQDEKEHIYETYKDVVIQSLDNDKYTKQKNQKININNNEYNTDVYTLTLTKTESLDLFKKILQNLKQDSITLNLICNKIKIINPDSEYASISKLTTQIDIYIEEIEKIEKSESEFIRVDVYKDKKIVRKIDISIENNKQISFEYEEKEGKENVQISLKNIVNEPNAIVYNVKESLLNTKKIKIIKDADSTTYQFVMYNIKDIYKEILNNMNEKENISIQDDNQNNIEEIKDIYNKYNDMNDESTEISLNIKLDNKTENKTKSSIYLLICNSKIGVDIVNEKEYTDNIENTVTLNEKNSIMLNKYSKNIVNELINALWNNGKNVLNKKINS